MAGVELNQDIVLVNNNVRSSMEPSSTVEQHDAPEAKTDEKTADADTTETADSGTGEMLFPWEWSMLVWEELFNSFALDPASLHIVHYYPGSGLAAIPALKRKFTYTCAAGRHCVKSA